MTEYERGFKDGVTSKMNNELQPLLSEILTGISEVIKNMPKYVIDNMELKATDRGRGQWSECYTDSRLYSGICSVCGGAAIRSVKANPLDYCPNCGARMIKDGDTE